MAGPFLACIILPRFHFGTFEHVAVAWQRHTWREEAAARMYPVWYELSSDLTRPESVEWVSERYSLLATSQSPLPKEIQIIRMKRCYLSNQHLGG